jgi:hypothetical protein
MPSGDVLRIFFGSFPANCLTPGVHSKRVKPVFRSFPKAAKHCGRFRFFHLRLPEWKPAEPAAGSFFACFAESAVRPRAGERSHGDRLRAKKAKPRSEELPTMSRGLCSRDGRTCSPRRAFFPWLRIAGCNTSFRRLHCNCNWDARTFCYRPLVAPFFCGAVLSAPAG